MGKIKKPAKNEQEPQKKKHNNPNFLSGVIKKKAPVNKVSVSKPVLEKAFALTTKNEVSPGVLLRRVPKKIVDLQQNEVKAAVDTVHKLVTLKLKEKKELFEDAHPIFMQIVCIKVPKCPYRILRIPVTNSLLTDLNEVCLIVPDLEKKSKDHEKCIEHYEDLLRTNDVTNIKAIIPYAQLKTEYDQYEMKRRLVDTYDHFLVDAKIAGPVSHTLGKIFMKKRKQPTPVQLELENMKYNIDRSLAKLCLTIHSNGDTFVAQVGHTKMDLDDIVQNIFEFVGELENQFPGGGGNIRALYLKGKDSKVVPLYYTMTMKRDVPVPVVQALRPKAFKVQQGELSTKANAQVSVLPSGKVVVRHLPVPSEDSSVEDDSDNGTVNDAEENDDEPTTKPKKSRRNRRKRKLASEETTPTKLIKQTAEINEVPKSTNNNNEEIFIKKLKKNKGKAADKENANRNINSSAFPKGNVIKSQKKLKKGKVASTEGADNMIQIDNIINGQDIQTSKKKLNKIQKKFDKESNLDVGLVNGNKESVVTGKKSKITASPITKVIVEKKPRKNYTIEEIVAPIKLNKKIKNEGKALTKNVIIDRNEEKSAATTSFKAKVKRGGIAKKNGLQKNKV